MTQQTPHARALEAAMRAPYDKTYNTLIRTYLTTLLDSPQMVEKAGVAIENEQRLIQLDIIDGRSPTPESLSSLYSKAVIAAIKKEAL